VQKLEVCEAEVAKHDSTLEKLQSAEKKLGEEAARGLAKLQEIEGEVSEGRSRQSAMTGELIGVREKLEEASSHRQESESGKKVAEALAELQRLYPDVHGRLVDLVEPTNGRYTTAMDVGMGRYGDAIVVDSSQSATRCIEFLRERRVKPCLFLPMSDLRPKPRDAAFDHLGSAFRRLRDVIRAESRYSTALDYVCGNIIVANSLEDAIEQRYKKGKETKFVTLDGVVVAKNGNMTGGASALDRAGSRRRVSEKELVGLRKRRDELLREEAVLRRRLGLGDEGGAGLGPESGAGSAGDGGTGAMDGTALREAG